MKLLITGVCGFVGSALCGALLEQPAGGEPIEIHGIDNLSRMGSEINRPLLARLGVRVVHGDLRNPQDLEQLPACDFVIDAAANPSVLAGVDGQSSSRQVFDHNLSSTIHLLEYCKKHRAGFTLISTSRVYSIAALAGLPMAQRNGAFTVARRKRCRRACPPRAWRKDFSTTPPISLYGVSKLASELLALEYGETFGFAVWINRCGVLAGAGQFGRADQGIFSYWINAYLRRRPLKYIGFGGQGFQARDAFHPRDLVPLLRQQFEPDRAGGDAHLQPGRRAGQQHVASAAQPVVRAAASANTRWRRRRGIRPFDIPWMVMDYRLAASTWGWKPQRSLGA